MYTPLDVKPFWKSWAQLFGSVHKQNVEKEILTLNFENDYIVPVQVYTKSRVFFLMVEGTLGKKHL